MEDEDVSTTRISVGEVMSNLGCRINGDVEVVLRSGPYYAQHSAWEFCGYVWFADDIFHEQVKRYRVHVDTLSASTLPELMQLVNDKWGWE